MWIPSGRMESFTPWSSYSTDKSIGLIDTREYAGELSSRLTHVGALFVSGIHSVKTINAHPNQTLITLGAFRMLIALFSKCFGVFLGDRMRYGYSHTATESSDNPNPESTRYTPKHSVDTCASCHCLDVAGKNLPVNQLQVGRKSR